MAVPNDPAALSLQRLARLTQQRRAALHWSMEKVAQEAGVTFVTYSRIEKAQTVRAGTLAKVERALDFQPSSCRAVLDGATSIHLTDGTELLDGGQIRTAPAEGMPDAVRAAVTNAMIAMAPDATGRDIKEAGDLVVEDLRRRGFFPELEE